MGLGSDTAGGAESDIGGSESNADDSSDSGDTLGGWEAQVAETGHTSMDPGGIGSLGTDDGSYDTAVSTAISQMTVAQQVSFFNTVVDPVMSTAYGTVGNTATSVMSSIFGLALTQPLSALNTVIGWIKGVTPTKALANKIRDEVVSGYLAGKLGISSSNVDDMSDNEMNEKLSALMAENPSVIVDLMMISATSENVSDVDIVYRRRSNIIGTGTQGLFIE